MIKVEKKPELRITMRHARAVCQPGQGVSCASGIRAWFAKHDLDFRQFLTAGIPISEVEAIDDYFTRRICAIARQEAGHGRP